MLLIPRQLEQLLPLVLAESLHELLLHCGVADGHDHVGVGSQGGEQGGRGTGGGQTNTLKWLVKFTVMR